MQRRSSERGSALLMSIVVILLVTVFGLAVVRFSAREVSGAIAGRKEAAVAACAEAARAMIMSQWKLLGANGVTVPPLDVVLDSASQTHLQGGHYDDTPGDSAHWNASSQTWVNNIQVAKLNPLTVGSSYQSNDLTNRVGDTIQSYRVVVHCTQADGREVEVEFGVQYGL